MDTKGALRVFGTTGELEMGYQWPEPPDRLPVEQGKHRANDAKKRRRKLAERSRKQNRK